MSFLLIEDSLSRKEEMSAAQLMKKTYLQIKVTKYLVQGKVKKILQFKDISIDVL